MISSRELYHQQMLLDPDMVITRQQPAGTYNRRKHEMPFTEAEIAEFIRRDAEAEQRYWDMVDQEKERGL